MKNAGGILIGIVAAAAVGVIVGMLISPEKGEDLRRTIKDTADDWTKKLGNLVTDGKEGYESVKSSMSEGAKDLIREAKKL